MPPTPDEIELEKVKKELSKAKNEIAVIASQQVSISQSIPKLKNEIAALENKRDSLNQEVSAAEALKAKRASERAVDLDDREMTLNFRENNLNTLSAEIKKREDSLADEKVIIFNQQDKLNALEANLEVLKESLNTQLADANQKQQSLDTLINDYLEKSKEVSEKNKQLDHQINKYQSQRKEVDDLISQYKQKFESLEVVKKHCDDRTIMLQEKIADVKDRGNVLGIKLAEVAAKEAKLAEGERLHKKKLAAYANRDKEIRLAWLKIKNEIQKHKLDQEIAKLENSLNP